MTFKVDEDFKKCLPELTAEEYTELEKDVAGKEFRSRDEAIEWILRNRLKTWNLNAFQRNAIVLKNEDAIIRAMKKRQVKIGDHRVQLAKIAETTGDNIQWTKFIINNGTSEQIARARKGGKENNIYAIANDIIIKDAMARGEETRKCKRCGETLPITKFYLKSGVCNKCKERRRREKTGKRITGREIIGNLYDTDRVIEYTDDDLKEELVAKIEDFKWSVQNCLKIHADLLKDKRSREKVLSNLTLLQSEITKWKELYDYE